MPEIKNDPLHRVLYIDLDRLTSTTSRDGPTCLRPVWEAPGWGSGF